MRRTALSSAALVVSAITLVSPQSAAAGIIDYIIEMSGPAMVGLPLTCEFDLQSSRHECRFIGGRIPRPKGHEIEEALEFRAKTRLSLTVGGGFYFSTGKDSEMRDFEAFHVYMLAYEPMLNVRTAGKAYGDFIIHHGVVGLSYFFLAGTDFKRFENLGIKMAPIALTYRHFTASYNVRMFPNGFSSGQFGADPAQPTTHQGREFVHGATIGFWW